MGKKKKKIHISKQVLEEILWKSLHTILLWYSHCFQGGFLFLLILIFIALGLFFYLDQFLYFQFPFRIEVFHCFTYT